MTQGLGVENCTSLALLVMIAKLLEYTIVRLHNYGWTDRQIVNVRAKTAYLLSPIFSAKAF